MSELDKKTIRPEEASAISSGVARRRMILASLGKGSAVVAAVAVPMQSLAAIGTLSVTESPGGKRCTISGTMSGVHSNETVTTTCAGGSPNYYKTTTNWPPNLSPDTLFVNLFGGGSSGKLIDILNGSAGTPVEARWISALLNGTPGSYGEAHNFPYTAAQVIAFYQADSSINSPAWKFFRDYMETKVS